jgi:predicted transcriptional regulator
MTRKLVEISADIIQNQVSTTPMSSDELVASLQKVFRTLQDMQRSETDGTVFDLTKLSEEALEEKSTRQLEPRDSIQQDKIVCLECGAEMRQLTARHLASHDLTPRQYRKKHGFTMRTPLSSKSLTKARSKAAKKRGLPEKLVQFLEAKKQQKAAAGGKASSPSGDAAAGKESRAPRRKKIVP